jgi:protein SCO1/2
LRGRHQGARLVWLLGLVFGVVGLGLTGCHAGPQPPVQPRDGYFVRGQIEGVDTQKGTVVLSHEAIQGLMPAMTMEYPLVNPTEVSELHPGDRITATMLADKGPDGPTNLRLTDLDVIAQARPDTRPPVQYHVPAVGETVPDFTLLNQSGKKIGLDQFRGKVVALTFVYTRCPVADYCVRMSRNFAAMNQALAADPKLYAKTHLLTVSFDPAYDTPKVLRSYGGAYTGKYSQETFAHWDFAAPSEAELPKMEQWFDVGVTSTAGAQAAGKQFQHSLATAIIGADGKVLAFYPTNEWTVPQALSVMRGAAAG